MDTDRPATLPAAKALMRNRLSWNSGSATLVSMMPSAASSTAPPASSVTTQGSVYPIVCPPWGWMP